MRLAFPELSCKRRTRTNPAAKKDNTPNSSTNADFDPSDYAQDIEYIKQNSEYKWEVSQSKVLERMMAFDNAKTSVTYTKARWDRASQNSLRSSSPARSFVM